MLVTIAGYVLFVLFVTLISWTTSLIARQREQMNCMRGAFQAIADRTHCTPSKDGEYESDKVIIRNERLDAIRSIAYHGIDIATGM